MMDSGACEPSGGMQTWHPPETSHPETPHRIPSAAGFSWQQRCIDLLERRYLRWKESRRQAGAGSGYSSDTARAATLLPRLLRPLFPEIVWRIEPDRRASASDDPSDRVCALTFDDGPCPGRTEPLLDLLAEYEIPGTFFLVGQAAQAHPQLVRRIVSAGHQIGNHTWSHRDAWSCPFPLVAEELARTRDQLEQMTGQAVPLIRPPHGHFTAKYRRYCVESQSRLVMWDTLPGDFVPGLSAGWMASFAARWLRPGSILVWHDSLSADRTVAALRYLLPPLIDQGWQFRRVRDPFQEG